MATLIETARPADKEAVIALLQQNQLPTDDLPVDLHGFVVAREQGTPIGVAGLERTGPVALLRSVAVDSRYRGRQIAAHLIGQLLETARTAGLEEIYLITTSAGPYFERYGFQQVNRQDVPTDIQQTQQFSQLCPSSAIIMKYNLPASNAKRLNP